MKMPWNSSLPENRPEMSWGRKSKKKTGRYAGEHAERSCRLDLRLTIAEKNKLLRKAVADRRTVTSIIVELIEGMR